mmetsp:Transcript_41501/g.72910  ORF Transcript_41501/g.72910 Transcript_41501/m.72910 type:complete len:1249 (-) Transcript_41501:354-4100(-)
MTAQSIDQWMDRQANADAIKQAEAPLKFGPQGSGKAVTHMTWSMVACILYSVVACVILLCFSALGGISPRWMACNYEEVWHAGASILLVFSSMVTETCLVVATSCNKQIIRDINANGPRVVFPGVGDPGLTLAEYAIKFVCGVYIWLCSGGVMHTDTLAVGGPRPVYFARFAQWSLAVPVLVLITNKAFIDSADHLFQRSWPAAVTCFFYVWVGWLMEVTTVHYLRWPLMVLAIGGAIVVSTDQICLAKENSNTRVFGSKLGMLAYQITSFLSYAVVFLMGRFGVVSSGTEQIIYAYMDVTVKVFQGSALVMIRNREGALEIRHWWLAASAASSDLRDLLHQARVPTLAINLAGEITDWNDSMRQLTGLTKQQVKGKILVDLSSAACKEDLRNELQQRLDAFSKAKDNQSPPKDNYPMLELSIPTRNAGSEGGKNLPDIRILAMMFVPKRDSAKNLEGAIAIGQDLSELAEMKLVQERKNALTAMISHEFRSPLHGMMGLVGVIMENPISQPMHRQLGMVKGCASRLLDMVTDVMTLAECEKRKMDGVTAPRPTTLVDFGQILDEAITMIGNSADKANKPLLKPSVRMVNAAAGAKLPLIRGDPCKCTQVVYNLLTNACKFTDRGSITISFRHLREEKRLAIDIADTGKGISEEAQARIFKPFEQESTKDVRSFQGIGLGLSVCKQVAHNHGGSLTVKSTVGQGSTFSFSVPCTGNLGFGHDMQEGGTEQRPSPKAGRFDSNMSNVSAARFDSNMSSVSACFDSNPSLADVSPAKNSATKMVKIEDKKANKDAQAALIPTAGANDGKKPLVLSVDDDEVNQEVIKNALIDFCEVVSLMDGFETMKYLDQVQKSQARCPDLVLLDIQMPGMTGFEVCDAIRNTFAYLPGKLPVTMVSAKAPADVVAIQAFDCGSTDFVSKPFNRDVLKRKVVAALNIQATVGSASSAYVLAQEARRIIQKHESAAKMATEQMEALKGERRKHEEAAKMACQQVDALRGEREKHEEAAKLAFEQVEALKLEREQMQSTAIGLQTEGERLKGAAILNAEHEATANKACRQVEALKEEQERMQKTTQALMEEVERLKNVRVNEVRVNERQQKVNQDQSEGEELVKQLDAQREQIKLLQQQLHSASVEKKAEVLEEAADAASKCKTTQPSYKLSCYFQSMNASRAVKLLTSRLQHSGSIARQCRELLTGLLFTSMPDAATSEEEQVHARLEEFKTCSKVVSSELAMLEQVSSNIDSITNLAVQ